ncbi:hypothetical protein MCHI_002694 [Candidatus Magnetoovum chiemensis]|nr:hypothetical protein MCHI_002694 [Candidatus Magnetoovum chiemensis]
MLYFFISYPIAGGDADMWYHLSHGRYIAEHKELPTTSYFSFITPQRQWIDYYWLHQVVLHTIYTIANYSGLSVFRDVIYFLTVTILLLYLTNNKGEKRRPALLTITVFTAYFLVLMGRDLFIRPHIMSYLFIVVFIYILEIKRDKIWCLPFLSVLWVNFHGIEYPVLVLIVLSYIIDLYFNRIKKKQVFFTKNEMRSLLFLGASMAAIFISPHGIKLLNVPFTSINYAAKYIDELKTLKPNELFNILLSLDRIDLKTILNILILFIGISFIAVAVNRRLNISRLLLFIGGVFLLIKGMRFVYEFILLSLPLVNVACANDERQKSLSALGVITMVLLMCIPFMTIKSFFDSLERHKYTYKYLPHGVTAFLNSIDAGGNVMNDPNYGGYFQWQLYPKYKIFMDMEVPFLFTDNDFFISTDAYYDSAVLGKIIEKYKPSFISAPLGNSSFGNLIKMYPQYKVVFFDDVEALYINENSYPDIAAEYELKSINPFSIASLRVNQLDNDAIDAVYNELKKIDAVYPHIASIHRTLAIVSKRKDNKAEAVAYAKKFIEEAPDKVYGYRFMADYLVETENHSEAVWYYLKAIDISKGALRDDLYKKLSVSYRHLGEHKKAYKSMAEAIDVFNDKTSYVELYNLGLLALSAGENDEAFSMFQFACYKVPLEKVKWIDRIKQRISMFENGNTISCPAI